MTGRVLAYVFSIAAIVALGYAAGTGWDQLSTVIIGCIGFIVMAMVGIRLATPRDRFLTTLIPMAYLAKLFASGARYWVLEMVYDGSGDATGYHGGGTVFAEVWRSFSVPETLTATDMVKSITGLLYAPYIPTKLGGFFIFATLAFVGQVLLYLAFRTKLGPRRLGWYAGVVFFLPTIIYWPSSIGKESLMYLGIGAAVYGGTQFMAGARRLSLLVLTAFGTGLCLIIRPHMAALVGAAMAIAVVLGSKRAMGLSRGRRFMLIVVVVGAAGALVYASAGEFGIDLGGDVTGEIDDFFVNLEGNTETGGSAVTGGVIRSPLELPEVTLRVLYRPLIYEAHNAVALASAVEGTALFLLTLWLLPSMLRNLRRLRRDPYLLFCAAYTFMFVIAFSSFLNLGLMARERSQVMPFLMVLLVELGRRRHQAEPDTGEAPTPRAGRRLSPASSP